MARQRKNTSLKNVTPWPPKDKRNGRVRSDEPVGASRTIKTKFWKRTKVMMKIGFVICGFASL